MSDVWVRALALELPPTVYADVKERIEQLVAKLAAAEEALLFYADPDSYFAIAIWPDRPAGAFADDFGPDDEFPDYGRPMPGKTARAYFLSGEPS